MVFVNLPDSPHESFVERFKQAVDFFLVVEVGCYGLVHQLIAQDSRLVTVATGYLLPDVAHQLLAPLAVEEPRIAIAIIDVVTSLSVRTVVHIENEVKTVGLAPAHHRVHACKAVLPRRQPHVVLVGEELVVERQAYRVGTRRGYEVYVAAGDVVVLELRPEVGSGIGAHQLAQHLIDHPRAVGLREAEHIPLGVEPVAKVCTLNIQSRPVGLHQIGALNANKAPLRLGIKSQGKAY